MRGCDVMPFDVRVSCYAADGLIRVCMRTEDGPSTRLTVLRFGDLGELDEFITKLINYQIKLHDLERRMQDMGIQMM